MNIDCSKFKICCYCFSLYGQVPIAKENTGYQICSKECKVPHEECEIGRIENLKTWPGFDFQEVVTLCYCCGQELLPSGSRWSVWFCEECKTRVVSLNQSLGTAMIPIGRHSLMNGCSLSSEALQNKGLILEFSSNVMTFFKRIDSLNRWRVKIIQSNLRHLQLDPLSNVLLDEYLSLLHSNPPDKEDAFGEMCELFKTSSPS